MSGETILIVDDEPTTVEVVGLYFQREGFRVVIASDGPSALCMVEQQEPALVVLDLMLLGLGGLDITRQLRTNGALPIIMLTARGEEADRIVGLELGADDYVTKPFSGRISGAGESCVAPNTSNCCCIRSRACGGVGDRRFALG